MADIKSDWEYIKQLFAEGGIFPVRKSREYSPGNMEISNICVGLHTCKPV